MVPPEFSLTYIHTHIRISAIHPFHTPTRDTNTSYSMTQTEEASSSEAGEVKYLLARDRPAAER